LSINWQLADPGPALLVLPPAAASLDEAHAAIELWEHYSRKRLDSSQRLVVEVLMAQSADGRWAASTTGREMPRQNGKGDEIEVVELWGLVQRSEAILHTVHDAVLLASQTQQRMLGVLEGHGDLRRLVKRKWQGTGQQMIEMRNGGVIWYRTRTNGGGRGIDDVDRLVIDEAQHASEEHLAAVAPTLLANPNPQMNVMGTAGLAGTSDWWWRTRKRALSSEPGAFGYVGHTAERVHMDDNGQVVQPSVDVQDRSLWRGANPSVGAGRGQGMPFLEEQLLRLGEKAFAREHLGVWDPEPGSEAGAAIGAARWLSLVGPTPQRGHDVVFALDVAPDHSTSTITAAWTLPDGRKWLQVADYRPGVEWVPGRWEELHATWGGLVVVEQTGTAAFLLPKLDHADTVSRRFYADACSTLDADVTAGALRHGNQPELNAAVAAARWSSSGEAGQRVLSRKDPRVSPLVAAALSLHAVTLAPSSGGWMVSLT
jgi:hypothetical protein